MANFWASVRYTIAVPPTTAHKTRMRSPKIILLQVRNLWAIKEIPRIEGGVAEKFEDVPVVLAGAALADHHHLAAMVIPYEASYTLVNTLYS
jgi:hypothetical protein